MSKSPIIFLAFANEREDGNAYLRSLHKEQKKIQLALKKLEDQQLCQVIIRQSASISDIFDTFQDQSYNNRICLFHYGGHANSFQFLLEDDAGNNQIAHGEGLISFLCKQQENGLKAVILNGCSTQAHAHQLAESGIATIATSQSIHDDIATTFAERLYLGIANFVPFQKAFSTAIDYIHTEKGQGNLRDLYWEGSDETFTEAPWKLHLPTENSASTHLWTVEQAYQQLNLSESEFAKISFDKLVEEKEVDGQYIAKGLAHHLVTRYNLKKALAFLERELAKKDHKVASYLHSKTREVQSLRKLQLTEGSEEVEKRKSQIVQELLAIFN